MQQDPFAASGSGILEPTFPIMVTVDEDAPMEYSQEDIKMMDLDALIRLYKASSPFTNLHELLLTCVCRSDNPAGRRMAPSRLYLSLCLSPDF